MKKKVSVCFLFALLWTFQVNAANAEKLNVWMDNGIVLMEEEEYLRGVVAAEMPARYETEALKAQAVAARTLFRKGCYSHSEADVCTNSNCCQAFMTKEERLERWGEMAQVYEKKIRDAVFETDGEILLWEGEPILALFHASSGGETEDVELVYAKALPPTSTSTTMTTTWSTWPTTLAVSGFARPSTP